MTLKIDDLDSETASIHEVLLCWESGEDDSDALSVDLISEDIQGVTMAPPAVVIPESPRVQSPISFRGNNGNLEQLMRKYPDFVPDRLPPRSNKGTKPLCLFINYMGTRKPTLANPKPKASPRKVKAEVFEPSPYPTDAPMEYHQSRPKKKLKSHFVDASPLASCDKAARVAHISPYPTLGPSSTRNLSQTLAISS